MIIIMSLWYCWQAEQKISELEDQLLALEKKSQKKTNSLKAQFGDHKKRWLSVSEQSKMT